MVLSRECGEVRYSRDESWADEHRGTGADRTNGSPQGNGRGVTLTPCSSCTGS
jgi:hypothetical protein